MVSTPTNISSNDKDTSTTVNKAVGLNVNPTGAGVFGFSNFAETWNGRMAMIGLFAGFANEVLTGKGITGGISVLFTLFFVGFTVATLLGYYAIKATQNAE
jgi:hypothetical protein